MISRSTVDKGDAENLIQRINWINNMGYSVIVCKSPYFNENDKFLRRARRTREKSAALFILWELIQLSGLRETELSLMISRLSRFSLEMDMILILIFPTLSL